MKPPEQAGLSPTRSSKSDQLRKSHQKAGPNKPEPAQMTPLMAAHGNSRLAS